MYFVHNPNLEGYLNPRDEEAGDRDGMNTLLNHRQVFNWGQDC